MSGSRFSASHSSPRNRLCGPPCGTPRPRFQYLHSLPPQRGVPPHHIRPHRELQQPDRKTHPQSLRNDQTTACSSKCAHNHSSKSDGEPKKPLRPPGASESRSTAEATSVEECSAFCVQQGLGACLAACRHLNSGWMAYLVRRAVRRMPDPGKGRQVSSRPLHAEADEAMRVEG
jgi:hypothetical protein